MEGFNGSDMERNEMKSKGIKREGNASPCLTWNGQGVLFSRGGAEGRSRLVGQRGRDGEESRWGEGGVS